LGFIGINANSSIDCSDGLAFSLYQLIKDTKYGIKIDNNIIDYGDEWATKISQINDIELSELIFYGGEELGIVFTCSSKTYETMKKKHGRDIKLLGIVSNEKGVYYDGEKIQNKGWDHFN
jgi:thiamine monophosphate kinase